MMYTYLVSKYIYIYTYLAGMHGKVVQDVIYWFRFLSGWSSAGQIMSLVQSTAYQQQCMHSMHNNLYAFAIQKFVLNINSSGGPMKIYAHKHLTHKYLYAAKFSGLPFVYSMHAYRYAHIRTDKTVIQHAKIKLKFGHIVGIHNLIT